MTVAIPGSSFTARECVSSRIELRTGMLTSHLKKYIAKTHANKIRAIQRLDDKAESAHMVSIRQGHCNEALTCRSTLARSSSCIMRPM